MLPTGLGATSNLPTTIVFQQNAYLMCAHCFCVKPLNGCRIEKPLSLAQTRTVVMLVLDHTECQASLTNISNRFSKLDTRKNTYYLALALISVGRWRNQGPGRSSTLSESTMLSSNYVKPLLKNTQTCFMTSFCLSHIITHS